MEWTNPTEAELSTLRADPVIFEQELDVRPGVARALEQVLGYRAGRSYWRGASGTLYAIDLGDFGRGQPSMAIIHAFWPRFEPRPLSDEQIDEDLADFCVWMAEACDGLEVADVKLSLAFAMPSRRS